MNYRYEPCINASYHVSEAYNDGDFGGFPQSFSSSDANSLHLLSIFFRIKTSIDVLTKGKTAKNMKPAMVIKIILVESPRLAKNRPAKNSEMDNTSTCLLLLPNKPIPKVFTNSFQIATLIVFLLSACYLYLPLSIFQDYTRPQFYHQS